MPEEIEQIDAELTEDGRSVMFYGAKSDPDRTYTSLIELPKPISESDFAPTDNKWRRRVKRLHWTLHA
jgi:hypothetical protein